MFRSFKNKLDLYSDDELKKITDQWLQDKARIDDNFVFGYYYDQDQEYERHLNNNNLKALFRHAARIRKLIIENEPLYLYKNEDKTVLQVYGGILKNGYYSRSKTEEKRTRAWFGKIISRQSYKRFKRK